MKSHNDKYIQRKIATLHALQCIELLGAVLQDCERTVASYSHKRDMKTIISRVKHEGLSFVTITLPDFGSDFFSCLASGKIDSNSFRSFRMNGAIPAFLQGMTSLVFDQRDGRILDEPSIAAIANVRQVCLMYKKLKLPCTGIRIYNALQKFKEDELIFDDKLEDVDISDFLKCSGIIWGPFASRNLSCDNSRSECKHGPGGTAEGLSGNGKFYLFRYHDRLEPYFPLVETHFHNASAYDDKEVQKITVVPRDQEQPVRVLAVPKTLKTPRIIACEPVCMQYAQQGLSHILCRALERYPLTAGHINFTDQSINARLALEGSKCGNYATLDLSSASDRVPYDLAMHMFDWNPDFQGAVDACRSWRAQLPTGEVLTLRKFASMGSALCFPIEAMYFYTVCIVALMRKYNLPYTHSNVMLVTRRVFIYGDDIIVPNDAATEVIDTLQKYYCKVGTTKSFWTGKFRESCGMDAYDGIDITPVYIRETCPDHRGEASALISLTASCNHLYRAGLWLAADKVKTWLERIVGKLPIVSEKCAGLGLHSFQRRFSIDRWSKRFQRPEVRTLVPSAVYRRDPIDGIHALMKSLSALSRQEETSWVGSPKRDPENLARTARHGAVVLKRRWVDPT